MEDNIVDGILFKPNIEKMILSVTDAAFYLNCSASEIYKMIYEGKIPAYKKGRQYQILTEDLFRLIESKAHTFD